MSNLRTVNLEGVLNRCFLHVFLAPHLFPEEGGKKWVLGVDGGGVFLSVPVSREELMRIVQMIQEEIGDE